MKDRFSAPRLWGMFNLNDPRWGRGDEPSGQGDQRPSEPPPPPPPPPPRGGGGGRGPNQGPPDLDELWRDFNRKLTQLFGGRGGGQRRGGSGGFQPPGMKNAGIGLGVVACIAVFIWLCTGVFVVQEGEQAVITQFGKYRATVNAGLNWHWPYPIERKEEVITRNQVIDVGSDDITIQSTGLRDSAMLTQDENIVQIKFSVQYRVSDSRAWRFESENPETAVRQAAESAVREVVGQMTMDNAMKTDRDQIAPRVRDLMQKILDRYKIGVDVAAVNIAQEGVRQPDQVKEAFDDVLKADQDHARYINEAKDYANKVVPQATGEAARMKQEAEGYKARVVAQAQGEAQRFEAVLAEYQKAPQVTRERMYLDTMRDIYSGASKVIIDGKTGGGNLTVLPLDKLAQAAAAPSASAAAPDTAAAAAPSAAPAPASPAADTRLRDDPRSRARPFR